MKKPYWLELLEYFLVLFFEKLFLLVPDFILFKLADMIGYLVLLFSRSLREEVDKGLGQAFSNTKSDQDIHEIRRKCFVHLVKLLFEILQFSYMTHKKLTKRIHFSKESLNTIKTLSQKGKGIICVSAHYGNWELLALVIASLGYSLNIVIRPLDNKLLNEYLNKRRQILKSRLIERENAYLEGCGILNKNEILALMIDQNQAKNGIFVPFFGKEAATAKGVAILAKRSNAPVMAAHIHRNPDHTHTVTFKEIKVQKLKSIKDYVYCNTRNFTSYFENVIRHQPEQWLWFHPRWKTRPPSEKPNHKMKIF